MNMALIKSNLSSSLESWMLGSYTTTQESMSAFIDAYDAYAMLALDVSGDNPEVFLKDLNKKYNNKTIILSWGEKGAYAIAQDKQVIFSPAIRTTFFRR